MTKAAAPVRQLRSLSRAAKWTLATVGTALIATGVSVGVPAVLRHKGPGPTSVEIVSAVTGAGLNPHLKIAASDHGACQSGSESDLGNPDAFRCFGQRKFPYKSGFINHIYDPCFPESANHYVCMTAPWETTAYLFTDPRAEGAALGKLNLHEPWAIKLSNGQECSLAGGATSVVAGLRQNYFCVPGDGSAYGLPDEKTKVWTIPYGGKTDTVLQPTGIETAWY